MERLVDLRWTINLERSKRMDGEIRRYDGHELLEHDDSLHDGLRGDIRVVFESNPKIPSRSH